MVNQSHTSYVLRGYLFWGVKLTYTINRQEGSLVAGAGAGTKRPEPRLVALFKREIYHAPVGWYFSGYWLTERKAILQHHGLMLQQLLAEAAADTSAAPIFDLSSHLSPPMPP